MNKKILFYFGHPAQYLFARNTIKQLIQKSYEIKIIIKTKDVLETLLKNDGMEYENILTKERGGSKISIIFSLLKRNLLLLPIILKFKPDLLIGTDATIAQLGKLLNINRITILEDDYKIIKSLANITYPFTQTIFCPTVCDAGKWDSKKIGYSGYMKLGYLHPNIFKVNKEIINKYKLPDKYAIIRLAKLTAHHDFGIKGIDYEVLEQIINILESKRIKVFLSTEGNIDSKYKQYLLNINPNDIHHILAKSQILICDSQSMSVEASILGVPSIRVSSFAGKISVLEELEHKYNLTFGINPQNINQLFIQLKKLLSIENLQEEFINRRNLMLEDKIDVSKLFTWFIEQYPKSIEIIKIDSKFQNKFK
jgi:uncharacterized protein